MVQADHTGGNATTETLRLVIAALVALILHALQVVHLVGFLPAEEDGGDDDEEHVEGHLEVDLLLGHGLVILILVRLVRAHDEAHDGTDSQGDH